VSPPADVRAAELQEVFEVNVFGPIRVTNAFLPLLRTVERPQQRQRQRVGHAAGHQHRASPAPVDQACPERGEHTQARGQRPAHLTGHGIAAGGLLQHEHDQQYDHPAGGPAEHAECEQLAHPRAGEQILVRRPARRRFRLDVCRTRPSGFRPRPSRLRSSDSPNRDGNDSTGIEVIPESAVQVMIG
jgi:hypothetical protein